MCRKLNCELSFITANNKNGGLFNLGDVYIYPTTKEGVGLTITEAMCTGMPVVTSNYPTMNEWFNDNIEGRLINIAKIKKGSMPMDKVFIVSESMVMLLILFFAIGIFSAGSPNRWRLALL